MLDNAKISIIIPCLNEEKNISSLLEKIQTQENIVSEIIVVDGGSSDCTQEIAKKMGVKVVQSEKGRAKQMNAGRNQAQHELLLFLHADSKISHSHLFVNAYNSLVCGVAKHNSQKIAGHFSLRFACKDSHKSFGYIYYEEKSKLNRRDVFGGDQGLFIWGSFFDEIGGFDENLSFLEDKKISREILDKGTMITLPGYLGTSARRFETEGFLERTLVNVLSQAFLGVSSHSCLQVVEKFYQEQNNSNRLNLHIFFSLLEKAKPPLLKRIPFYLPLGRYTRVYGIWQVFFYLDTRRRYSRKNCRSPLLFLYDKWIFPLTNFFLFDIITTVFMVFGHYWFWFYYWLRKKQ